MFDSTVWHLSFDLACLLACAVMLFLQLRIHGERRAEREALGLLSAAGYWSDLVCDCGKVLLSVKRHRHASFVRLSHKVRCGHCGRTEEGGQSDRPEIPGGPDCFADGELGPVPAAEKP